MPEFSNTWFNERTLPIWEKHVKDLKINSYLEIGVSEGQSMRWVLENLKPDYAVGVDHWKDAKGRNHEHYEKAKAVCEENLSSWISDGTVELHQMDSFEYLCEACFDDKTFDLIYIDGNHNGYEAMLDMLMAYRLLSRKTSKMETQTIDSKGRTGQANDVGGIMIIDDLHRRWHFGKPLCGIAEWQFEFLMIQRMHKLWRDGRQCAYIRMN
jgi:hypothetical protein